MPIGWLDKLTSAIKTKLAKPRVVFADFIKDHAELESRLGKAVADLNSELAKLKDMAGAPDLELSDLKRLAVEQRRLGSVVYRLELSLKSLADLRREAAEWRRLSSYHGTEAEILEAKFREQAIAAELALRDFSNGGVASKFQIPNSKFYDQQSSALSEQPSSLEPAFAPKTVDSYIVKLSYLPPDDSVLHVSPEHLVARIKELSREIARTAKEPQFDRLEMVATLRELQDLHQALRKNDRRRSVNRDRLAITDGFRHLFASH